MPEVAEGDHGEEAAVRLGGEGGGGLGVDVGVDGVDDEEEEEVEAAGEEEEPGHPPHETVVLLEDLVDAVRRRHAAEEVFQPGPACRRAALVQVDAEKVWHRTRRLGRRRA